MTAPAPARLDPAERIILVLCVAAGFTTILDQSMFSLAVPSLRDSLHATPAQLQLILSMFSITFGIALVPAGRLGDIIGRRRLFLIGFAVFTAFSLLSGAAQDANTVIAGRMLQGLGAGIINTQVMGLIQDVFQGAQRAQALGAYAASVGLSGALGPLVGGVLLSIGPPDVGWRLLFLVSVPFGVTVFLLGLRHLPRPVDARQPGTRRLGGLDGVGLTLLTLTTLALMASSLVTEQAVPVWVYLLAAAVFGAGFFWWERRYAARGRTPVLTPGLARSRGYVLGTVVAAFQFATGLTLGTVSTLFFLDGLGWSPLLYAALSLPRAATMFLASTNSWRFVTRFGRPGVVWVIAASTLLLVIESLAVALLPVSGIIAVFLVVGAAQGVTGGLITAPNQTLTLGHAPPGGAGVAAGFLQLSQRLMSALGVTVGTGLFLLVAAAGTAGSVSLEQYRLAFLAAAGLVVLMSLLSLAAAWLDARRQRRAGRS